MAGAFRPPWIDKEMFYRMPFNFCDRWCEKCLLTSLCRVYQDGEKAKAKYRKMGKDPDSWEFAAWSIKESLTDAFKLLEKGAKKWGINLEEVDDSDYREPPEPKEFPLYNLAQELVKTLDKHLVDLSYLFEGTKDKYIFANLEIVSYYRSLIPNKIYRALTSRLREEQDPFMADTFDAKTSAFIAFLSLVSLTEALVNLAEVIPSRLKTKSLTVRLARTTLNLAKILNLEFSLREKLPN